MITGDSNRRRSRLATALAIALAALNLAACQSLQNETGMQSVAALAEAPLGGRVVAIGDAGDEVQTARRVQALLARPMTPDRAVQIALFNNRGLQAAYNELGLAEAQWTADRMPPNPTISVSRLASAPEIELEGKIVANILALATLPQRSEIAADRFQQAQMRAALETLRVGGAARSAFFRAVAARQRVGVLSRARSAAQGIATAARELGATGAVTKLDQAREQAFYAEVSAQLASARLMAASEQEKLIRVLGLWGNNLSFKLPDTLPSLSSARALPDIEREAVARRVDLQIARLEVAALAKTHQLTGSTRFINLLEASAIGKDAKDRATGEHVRTRGFEMELQIPIFDGGAVRMRQAEQSYALAVNRLVEKAVNVRSEARDAYRSYRGAHDIALHYRNEILPLRKLVREEMLLRYNAMQIDALALLTEIRQQSATRIAVVDAQLAFWLAETNLLGAIVGGAGTDTAPASLSVAAESGAGAH